MLNPQQITEHLLQQRLALTSYTYTITRNFHLAEDVYQETSVKAMSQSEKFESTEHLTNWFRLCARNRAIDIIRTREGRYVGLSEETLNLLDQHWSSEQYRGSGEDSNRETLLAALSECLETLTPRSQQIIKLRYFENRSGREIASYLGSKVQSAYQAIARIHKSGAREPRTESQRDTFLCQIAAYQDGGLSESELAQFDRVLRNDAEKMHLFIEVQKRSAEIAELSRRTLFAADAGNAAVPMKTWPRFAPHGLALLAIAACIGMFVLIPSGDTKLPQPHANVWRGHCFDRRSRFV